jgi:hypothetical protein
MKKSSPIYCVTAGDPKKLVKPVVWTVLTNLSLFSFALLAILVTSIFSWFAGETDSLDMKRLWLVWGGMVLMAVVLYFLERKATHATYHDGYATSAGGRARLAEHIRKLPPGVSS